jgi:hypothetical protein
MLSPPDQSPVTMLGDENVRPPLRNRSRRYQNKRLGQGHQRLGRSLGGNQGGGGFNALYLIGGPRSIQFALKLLF